VFRRIYWRVTRLCHPRRPQFAPSCSCRHLHQRTVWDLARRHGRQFHSTAGQRGPWDHRDRFLLVTFRGSEYLRLDPPTLEINASLA